MDTMGGGSSEASNVSTLLPEGRKAFVDLFAKTVVANQIKTQPSTRFMELHTVLALESPFLPKITATMEPI